MPYIAPNSTVRLLTGVPLDNTYKHTIYFASASAQQSFFSGKTAQTFTTQSYVRVNQGRIRLNICADDVYNCNYLMFQNTNFGNKWFYAFITAIEYVSNDTCEIGFELDCIQTWFFDFDLNECMVLREHSSSDAVGSNTQPEPVTLGPYISQEASRSGHTSDKVIVAMSNIGSSGEPITAGGPLAGSWVGCNYTVCHLGNESSMNSFAGFINNIGDLAAIQQELICCFTYYGDFIENATASQPAGFGINIPKSLSNIDGYTPKNNKLFTYPYNFLQVMNDVGDTLDIRYEWYDGSNCQFRMTGDVSPNPQIVLVPLNYNNRVYNTANQLMLTDFPQVTFNVDSFKVWLAQMASNGSVNGMTSAIQSAVAGGVVGGGAGALGGLGMYALNTAISGALAYNGAGEVKGVQGSGVNFAAGYKDYYFVPTSISAEYARVIDNYFDVYGYATNRVKTPNRTARPQWNYVQTQNCAITGSVPVQDMATIKAAHDNGITYWQNGNNVGNYSLNNGL